MPAPRVKSATTTRPKSGWSRGGSASPTRAGSAVGGRTRTMRGRSISASAISDVTTAALADNSESMAALPSSVPRPLTARFKRATSLLARPKTGGMTRTFSASSTSSIGSTGSLFPDVTAASPGRKLTRSLSASAIEDRGHAMVINRHIPEIMDEVEEQMNAWQTASSDKALQKERDQAFSEWLGTYKARKKAAAAAERAAANAMKSLAAEAEANVKDADAAFGNWMQAKADQIVEARMKAAARPPSNVFKLSDARNAAEHYCEDDHIFALMDSLICGCEGLGRKGKNKTNPGTIGAEFTAATVQERIAEAQMAIREQEANDTRSKDEKALARTKTKCANKILGIICEGMTSFGSIIQHLRDLMKAADKTGSGRLEKEELKLVCEQLNLGFATPDFQELWACFTPDEENEISPAEFEEMIVDAEATRQIHDAPPPPTRRQILAQQVLAELGESKARGLVADVFDHCRAEQELEPALIGLWDLRWVLRNSKYSGLNTSKRTNLTRTFETVFKNLDVDKQQSVLAADLQFFIRRLLLKLKAVQHEQQAKSRGMSEEEYRENLMFRIGKVMLGNVHGTMAGEGMSIVPATIEQFKKLDGGSTNGVMNRLQFQQALQMLKFGLSSPQENTIIDAIDTDGNGQIDINEFVDFIRRTEIKVNSIAQAKKDEMDPRNHGLLINRILNDVCDSFEIMEPILQGIKGGLNQVLDHHHGNGDAQ
eukprot:gene1934-17316_t